MKKKTIKELFISFANEFKKWHNYNKLVKKYIKEKPNMLKKLKETTYESVE